MSTVEHYDVVVVGSGNAGFCAALAAKEHEASRVLLLEKAPEKWAGGNTTFTAGAFRTVFHGLQDVLPLVHNVPADLVDGIDMDSYTPDDFYSDLMKVTDGRSDPDLAWALIDGSNETTKWLAAQGVRFSLSFNRQAYKVDGRQKFWGGMVLAVDDGGKGLTRTYQELAASRGIEVRYSTPVVEIMHEPSGEAGRCIVTGVAIEQPSPSIINVTGGVVLCAGGFEASPTLRAQHLGPEWLDAHVRGTPYNTGTLLESALACLPVRSSAQFSTAGCHATCWDAAAPREAGDLARTNALTKSGYPLGLMLNIHGERFVDEGEDLRNFTYARFGKAILRQPGRVAFQLWDARGAAWLREEEYGDGVVEKVQAETLEEMAALLADAKGLLAPEKFVECVRAFNDAAGRFGATHPHVRFDPSRKDGVSTRSAATGGLPLDKTNWAVPLVEPPFTAVKVACGVTFTFAGLAADAESASVLHKDDGVIPGLFCAGEMLGGLFYGNYPGGSGLMAGAVFGRKAGKAAAERAKGRAQAANG